jgi:hypothetical protein
MLKTDLSLTKSVALPAAAAAASTASIDLGSTTLGPSAAKFRLRLVIPALPNLVSAKTCIVTLTDSADNSSFAAFAGAPSYTLTGANASLDVQLTLPPTTRRYLKATATIETGGGDNTAKTLTMQTVS